MTWALKHPSGSLIRRYRRRARSFVANREANKKARICELRSSTEGDLQLDYLIVDQVRKRSRKGGDNKSGSNYSLASGNAKA
jgi:putative IMPACT (imprinted ancient) family translation regulator